MRVRQSENSSRTRSSTLTTSKTALTGDAESRSQPPRKRSSPKAKAPSSAKPQSAAKTQSSTKSQSSSKTQPSAQASLFVVPEERPLACLKKNNFAVVLASRAPGDEGCCPFEGHQYVETARNQAGCWVVASPGWPYCIHVSFNGRKLPHAGTGFSAYVFVDGINVAEGNMPYDKLKKQKEEERQGKDPTTGELEFDAALTSVENEIRPFCFSVRPTIPTDKNSPDPQNYSDFGTIRVLVRWARDLLPGEEADPSMNDTWRSDLRLITDPVGEELVKARYELLGGLGPPEHDDSATRQWKKLPVKQVGNSMLFTFRYQERAWLQAQGKIPRD